MSVRLRRISPRAILGLVVLIVLLSAGVVALQRRPPELDAADHLAVLERVPLPVPRDIRYVGAELDPYVDEKSCAGCHPAEVGSHAKTPHAHSARAASYARDAKIFRASGELHDEYRDAYYRATASDGKLRIIGRKGKDRGGKELNVAIGSGEHGIAYLGMQADGSALMPRLQAFFKEDKVIWDWAPSLEPQSPVPTPLGTFIAPDEFARCLACHSTAVAMKAGRVDWPASRVGIGCQRCHGPAGKHLELAKAGVDAMRGGREIGLPRLNTMSANAEIALCGTCHRPLTPPQKGELPDGLARLQGIALRMSRCFNRSQEKLSCRNCHNAHTPVGREAPHYEKTCLGCHTAPKGNVCRVNTSSGCVGCHMGKEELTQFGSAIFTNHWIRTRPTAVTKQRKIERGKTADPTM